MFAFSSTTQQSTFSKGINTLGFENVSDQIEHMLKQVMPNVARMISLGSGDGLFEKSLEEKCNFNAGDIILIDPNPSQFSGIDGHTDFSTAQEYVKLTDNPDNCVMLLNWPYPNGEKNNGWDLQAIKDVNPKYIITIVDSTGGAGSIPYLVYLEKCGLPVEIWAYYGSPEDDAIVANHTVVHSLRKVLVNTGIFGNNNVDLVFLVRNDIDKSNLNFDGLATTLESVEITQECIVM